MESVEFQMSEEQFQILSGALREHCGLRFGEESRLLFEKRIGRRLRELGIGSFRAYADRLRSAPSGDREMEHLVDELTTNETYFFREPEPLRAMVEWMAHELPQRRATAPSLPLGIWSAGCSSGEEAYSAVILAIEAGLEPGVDFCVYGTDISRRMLAKARAAEYHEAAFRDTEPRLRDRYFEPRGEVWRLRDEIRTQVVFSRVNLMDPIQSAVLGSMDLILCRNVIMYIDREQRLPLIQRFWERLRPGGHLLLGHSESLLGLPTPFEVRHLGRDLAYRRSPAGPAAQPSPPPPCAAAPETGE